MRYGHFPVVMKMSTARNLSQTLLSAFLYCSRKNEGTIIQP
jgi:hypothetical protein